MCVCLPSKLIHICPLLLSAAAIPYMCENIPPHYLFYCWKRQRQRRWTTYSTEVRENSLQIHFTGTTKCLEFVLFFCVYIVRHVNALRAHISNIKWIAWSHKHKKHTDTHQNRKMECGWPIPSNETDALPCDAFSYTIYYIKSGLLHKYNIILFWIVHFILYSIVIFETGLGVFIGFICSYCTLLILCVIFYI